MTKAFVLQYNMDVYAKAVLSPSALRVQWTALSWHRTWRGTSSEDALTLLVANTPRNSLCLCVAFTDSWKWLCWWRRRSQFKNPLQKIVLKKKKACNEMLDNFTDELKMAAQYSSQRACVTAALPLLTGCDSEPLNASLHLSGWHNSPSFPPWKTKKTFVPQSSTTISPMID